MATTTTKRAGAVLLYLLTCAQHACRPLKKAALNDHVPHAARGRWNALDGVTLLGTESAVLDSVVHDVGCAGIRAHGGNDTLLRPGNLRVENNEIFGTSQWKRTYSPGIHWGGVGNTYSHNHVHDLPHNCILGSAARPT